MPPNLREDLQELEDLRAQRRMRGGMRRREQAEAGFFDSAGGPEENPRIQCCYANDPDNTFDYWVGTEDGVIADLVCYIADLHQVCTDEVVIASWGTQPQLESPLQDYLWCKLYIILLDDLKKSWHATSWVWTKDRMWAMARRQRGEKKYPALNDGDYMPYPKGPPKQLCPRGGARSGRPSYQLTPEAMQKQQMAACAHTKCHESCPSVDSRLIKTLLRENRMVSAVLHSKSQIQVTHVVIAALKRAGLTANAVDLQQRSGIQEVSEDEPSPQDQPAQEPAHQEPQAQAQPDPQQPAQPDVMDHPPTHQAQAPYLEHEHGSSSLPLNEIKDKINQLAILHQYQYVAAMRYDNGPIVQQMCTLHRDLHGCLQHLHTAVQSLENRMSMWETTFLPAVFERLAEIQPIGHQPDGDQQQQTDVMTHESATPDL